MDIINVGLGKNRVNGGSGDDKIAVASDRPGDGLKSKGSTLIGDQGSDSIAGGSAKDTIFASTEKAFGVDEAGEPDSLTVKDGKPVPNIIETGSGNDEVYGSQAEDVVTSHSKTTEKAMIRGGGDNDALVGGYGTDAIFGGPGDDYVVAEPSEVGARGATDVIEGVSFGQQRVVAHLPLPPDTTSSAKTLVGGLGNDHIIGGDGPSKISGTPCATRPSTPRPTRRAVTAHRSRPTRWPRVRVRAPVTATTSFSGAREPTPSRRVAPRTA